MSAAHPSSTIPEFRARAFVAIKDVRLQEALDGATGRFGTSREEALAELSFADELRDHLKAIRSNTLANLAEHLEEFERNARAAGAQVHWARDGDEAAQVVTGLARQNGVQLVTKTKSMATEEIRLNHKLIDSGIEPVETDLGEWIIQLADESPYHIIAPAIHKTRGQVAELFKAEAGKPMPANDIPRLTAEARRMLREKFLAAGMGVTGSYWRSWSTQ